MKINIESETAAQLFSYGSSLVFGISLVLTALWVTSLLVTKSQKPRGTNHEQNSQEHHNDKRNE